MPLPNVNNALNESGAQDLKSIGLGAGLPVTTEIRDTSALPTLKHLYMMYICMDSSGNLVVRKYVKREASANWQGAVDELLLKAVPDTPDSADPDWPDSTNGKELYSCDFKGAGKFMIVIGNRNWRFYHASRPGHNAIEFVREKAIIIPIVIGEAEFRVPGSDNVSFVNGKLNAFQTLGLPNFVCDNFCLNQLGGGPLKPDENVPIIFNINIRMPLISDAHHDAIIIVDPGGQNMGPS